MLDIAAAARIDPSEKHRSATRNTPQTARISRHGREGISYPFLTRGGKYLPAPERAKNPLQSPFRVGFPARTRPFPSVSLRVPPCSVPPRSRSSLFCRRARICRTSPPRLPPRPRSRSARSEEHTSELQSPCNLVCRLLLEKKK